jgi:putative holliday junction resolvase
MESVKTRHPPVLLSEHTLQMQPLSSRVPDFEGGNPSGRVLALDVGKKRIGLAITDALGISAQGLPTYQRTRIRDDLSFLAQLAQEKEVVLILVGKPLHMSGRESRQSMYTAEFAERLQGVTGLPITFWDERLTTVEAERILREGNASIEQRKKSVDRLAAVLLLESYLDAQRYAAGGQIG